MFGIFGICGLLVFILARPQEYVDVLQRLPMLYLCCAGAVGGFVLDVKLRRIDPRPVPILRWVIAFLLWCAICTAARASQVLQKNIIELGIMFIVFATLAHGVQTLRAFRVVAATVMAVCLFLTLVCIDQGLQERSCIISDPEHPGEGIPDGRPCEMADGCYGHDAEPGSEYRCEKAGMFGTYSIEDRVRYRGELHDPNELGMTVCIGAFSFLVAFANQRRRPLTLVIAALGSAAVFYCVLLTMSRGAIVVFAIIGGVYAVRRFGIAGLIAGGVAALPLVALGGRSGESADQSTQLRYEAWAAGIQMFKRSPIFGVGQRQFGENHYMTAHNSYVLALAELGFIGLVLFITLLYLSVKTLYRGVVDLEGVPGARPAQVWAMALLASFCGMLFSINTLSFSYHTVLWVFLGLGGGFVSVVRHHKPDFDVRITVRDMLFIVVGCLAFAFVVLPIFLRMKGA
jgi:hypothetical protein